MSNGYINSIEDALFLMESGDSSFHIGPVKQYTINDDHRADGISDHKEYDLDNGSGGKLTVYKRKGAYEIHHSISDKDGKEVSGKMIPNTTNVKKFYGTMKTVGTRVLNSGHPLRIVGNHVTGMFQHYNRMAHIFAKKEGHVVSDAKPYDSTHPDAKELSEITITRKSDWSPVTALKESITRHRTKKTIIDYTGIPCIGEKTEFDHIMDEIYEEQRLKGN